MSAAGISVKAPATGEGPTPSTPLAAMAPAEPVHSAGKQPAVFGTLLGMCPGGVGVYSSHYKSVSTRPFSRGRRCKLAGLCEPPIFALQMDESEYKGLKSYEHRLGDTITGYKFQCVELARRYLVANRGVVFDSIPMAYNICA